MVVAAGRGPFTYQWRKNGVAISGATSSTLTTTPVAVADGGAKFDVIVTNAVGSVTSESATLTVKLHSGANRLVGQPDTAGTTNGGGADVALFNQPHGVVVNSDGEIYVGDTKNYTVRKVSKDYSVSLLAGVPGTFGYQDGPGEAALFGGVGKTVSLFQPSTPGAPVEYMTDSFVSGPSSLALDSLGNIVLSDHANNVIRQISPQGLVRTIVGQAKKPGSLAGPPATALINSTFNLTTDTVNNAVYFDDYQASQVGIRRATSFDVGSIRPASTTDPLISGMATDGLGNVFFSTLGGNQIVELSAVNTLTVVAGSGNTASIDGQGPAASFCRPAALVRNEDASFFVYDGCSKKLRKVTATGAVSTLVDLTETLGTGGSVTGMDTYVAGQTLVVSSKNALYLVPIN
ncbi:NHL repeat-containing protein [Caballeronia grimmiae]|uniref:hypothetical protein n=1 Tax=Caballeronia grimmiae TaxID=1071679 RepID=UPI0038BA21DB